MVRVTKQGNRTIFFTPDVIVDLDRVAGRVRAGAKTFSQEEFDEHFRKKSQAWRDSHSLPAGHAIESHSDAGL